MAGVPLRPARGGRLRRREPRLGGFGAKLARGLRAIASPPPRSDLPPRFAAGIAGVPTTVLLARGDATAITYRDAVRGLAVPEPVMVETDSHSFARAGDMEMVEAAIGAALTSSSSRA